MHKIFILILIPLNIISGCSSKEEMKPDFTLAPELVSTPTINKVSIIAGDSFTTSFLVNSDLNLALAHIQNANNRTLGTFVTSRTENEYSNKLFTNCASEAGVYYPVITLENENGYTAYSPDSISDPVYYERTKRIQDSKGNIQTEIEVTDLLVPKIGISQPGQDKNPKLMVSIEKITKNESTLSIDYKLSNLGDRGVSNFSLSFWVNLESPPSEDRPLENEDSDGSFHFSTMYCVNAGESILSSIIVRKPSESGTAYALIQYIYPEVQYINFEEDPENISNVSAGFPWQ